MFVRMIKNLNKKFLQYRKIDNMSEYAGTNKRIFRRMSKGKKVRLQMKKEMKFDHEEERKIENIDTMKDSNLCNIIDKETEFKEKSQHEIELSEWPRITNEINESVEMIAKKPTILKSGLISDYKFYMKELFYKNAEGKVEVKPYTVGKYKRKPITSLRGMTDLFSSEYQSLSPKVYLSGDVIDISAIIFEKTWKKAIFIPTVISFYLFKDQWNPNYDWPMFHLVVAPTIKYILIPYVRDRLSFIPNRHGKKFCYFNRSNP